MTLGSHRLRFLWEEEVAPSEEALGPGRGEPAGIPRPMRRLARFVFLGAVATGLMSSVIGVRLIAPVDAQPSYHSTCVQSCQNQFKKDQAACKSLPSSQQGQCLQQATAKMNACKNSCGNGP